MSLKETDPYTNPVIFCIFCRKDNCAHLFERKETNSNMRIFIHPKFGKIESPYHVSSLYHTRKDTTTTRSRKRNGYNSSLASEHTETSTTESKMMLPAKTEDIKPVKIFRTKSIDKFEFAKIDSVSVFGSVSQSQKYSDLTIIVWPITGFSRLRFHLLYDNDDNLWILSIDSLDRTTYWTQDQSKNIVEHKFCSIAEAIKEIKKACLISCISPNRVLDLFLEACEKPFITASNEEQIINLVKSDNFDKMENRLSSSTNYEHGYPYHHAGCH